VISSKKGRTISFAPKLALRLAAGLALLIAGSLVFFFLNKKPEMLVLRSGASPVTRTLPDGSVVTLNKVSELRYPEKFSGDTRSVALNGEAFFEVAPDKTHPFTISANETSVRVVGTSFNVKSSAAATEVIVATGIVEVSRKQEAIRLLPNEATTVYKGRVGFEKRKTDDELYNYYRTQEFVCNNTPLSRLAEILGEAYNVRIEIPEPALRDLPMTVTFRNESLPDVLRVIGETLNIQAVQQGDRVIFKSR
jgi:ferric-dicitrate binding protein FerR (iron transport regulator)